MTLVAQDAESEPVGDPADAIVELCERVLVPSRNERDQCLVREMGVLLAHGKPVFRRGQS